MKKVFRYLLIIFGSSLLLGVIVSILVKVYEEYEERSWTPPTKIKGVSLGMTRSDLLFHFNYQCYGPPDDEFGISFLIDEGDVRTCDSMGSKDSYPNVRLKGDRVVSLLDSYWGSKPSLGPIKNVEDVQTILGDPDILVISNDMSDRIYVYLNHRSSFTFVRNELKVFRVGQLEWSDVSAITEIEEVFVRGKKICPSPNCPFSEDGSLEDDYPYKTPFDLPL